jgi:signal transduction histidine kinase
VARVVDDYRLLAAVEGATYAITLLRPDEVVPVFGDSARLEDVLHNLLSNAIKYGPDKGTVRVRVARQGDEAVLEVADEGIGLPQEARAHLFEPFFRAENIGARTGGFGLGLYIVHEIVQRHGGRIDVESAEGQGTTVRVVLPLRHEDP